MNHVEKRWQSRFKECSISALLLDRHGNIVAQTDDSLRTVLSEMIHHLPATLRVHETREKAYKDEVTNVKKTDGFVFIGHLVSLEQLLHYQKTHQFGGLAQEVFFHFDDGLLMVDDQGKIIAINPKAVEFFDLMDQIKAGIWLEDESSYDIKDFFKHLPVDDWPLPPHLMKGIEVHDEPYVFPSIKRTRTLSRTVYHLKHGSKQYIVAQFKELSHFINIDEKILRTDRLATIGQMAAGTAHEIRNPLTSIRGFLQILQETLKEKNMETEYGYVQLMLKEIARINTLVEQFLLLGKPRDVRFRKINLEKVLDDIIPVLKSEAMLHNIHIHTEYPETLPEIIADPDLIKQVVINIVKNAIEAIDHGGKITIDVKVQTANKMVEINIHDTGPGIPPYILDRIFDPFFTTKEKGSGLGLSVCQRIVQDMGGNIRVLSKGYGTTFQVVLPFASHETCADES